MGAGGRHGGRRGPAVTRATTAVLATVAALGAALACVAPAAARGPLRTVVQDDAQLLHRTDAETAASLDDLRALGVDVVRVTASWSSLTRDADGEERPADFDDADPAAYEQARWAALDRLVRGVVARDMDVIIDIAFWAPHWATEDPPGPRARTAIDTAAYGRFAGAVARRYSGTFTPPPSVEVVPPSQDASLLDVLFGRPAPPPPAQRPDDGPLPRVSLYGIWNEPNHPAFLLPQLTRTGAAASPATYRRMVRAADAAIDAAQPRARVLIGGLASKDAGRRGVAPLRFVRALACVDAALRPIRTGDCRGFRRVPGDGFTIHPYSLHTPPDARPSARQPDDVPMGALPRLTALLDRLVARGRFAPGVRDVWVTEYGYETNPPSDDARYGLGEQARFLPWGEYLAWRDPRVVGHAQFLLRDLPPAATRQTASRRRGFGQWLSGVRFADGRAKPGLAAFRAGVFTRPLATGGGRFAGVFGRVRPARRPVEVELQVRRSASGPWTALPSGVGTRGVRRLRFRTAADGTFDRVVASRAVAGASTRVRLRWRPVAPSGSSRPAWRAGPGLAPLGRLSPLP